MNIVYGKIISSYDKNEKYSEGTPCVINRECQNGIVFGRPKCGKTFFAKKEIKNLLKEKTNRVIVFNSQGEYNDLADCVEKKEFYFTEYDLEKKMSSGKFSGLETVRLSNLRLIIAGNKGVTSDRNISKDIDIFTEEIFGSKEHHKKYRYYLYIDEPYLHPQVREKIEEILRKSTAWNLTVTIITKYPEDICQWNDKEERDEQKEYSSRIYYFCNFIVDFRVRLNSSVYGVAKVLCNDYVQNKCRDIICDFREE